ncbi:kringle domain-containing protein [Babesia ovata]|uniref:Kringle domain-containing protein n=1 Tax=Babesia ovata TaxID=189622 RepID=A0A2H6KHV7_9APIC|nr:kringle domain-containing protein [Babesia ovata]GBE62574.1 kringle domain-containing protein [Babesia ovata]
MAARYTDNAIHCLRKTALDYERFSGCWDECGLIIQCFGAPIQLPSTKGHKPSDINWDDHVTHCPCNGDISDETNSPYTGCESITRDNKVCRHWNTIPSLPVIEDSRSMFIQNYCRNITPGNLVCYISDTVQAPCPATAKQPKDAADAKGPRLKAYLQPGTIFDLWIGPYIPTYKVVVGFAEENKPCGGELIADSPIVQSYASQPYDVYTGRWSMKYAKHSMDIYPSLDDSNETFFVLKGFKVMRDATNTTVTVCGCISSQFYYRELDNVSCDRSSQFTMYLGTIRIMGEAMPDTTQVQKDNMTAVINAHGDVLEAVVTMVHKDDVDKALPDSPGEDYLYPVEVFFHVEETLRRKMLRSKKPGLTLKQSYTEYILPRAVIQRHNSSTLMKVTRTGTYMAISQETNPPMAISVHMAPLKVMGVWTFTGYDVNLKLSLINSDSAGSKALAQSLFFRSWKIAKRPLAIILSAATDSKPCSKPFGVSQAPFPVTGSVIEEQETIWRANRFWVDKTVWKNITGFNICLFRENDNSMRLGRGVKVAHVDHKFSHLHPDFTEVPSSVSTYMLRDEWDLIAYHASLTVKPNTTPKPIVDVNKKPSQEEQQLELFLSSNQCNCSPQETPPTPVYPVVLSFWCMKDANMVMVFRMTAENLSPIYLGKFEVNHPIAMELIVNYDSVKALVMSEGEREIIQYDVTIEKANGLRFTLKKETTSCEDKTCVRFMSPADMKVIRFRRKNQQTYLVIVTDADANCIVLLNSKLMEVSRICDTDYIPPSGIKQPSRIACAPLPTGESYISDYVLEKNEVYRSCYITQKHDGSVLWVQVELEKEKLSVHKVYTGVSVDTTDSMPLNKHTTALPVIRYPSYIEIVSYETADLLYVVQHEAHEILTFIIDRRDSTPKIFYYGKNAPKGVPYGIFLGIKGVQMSYRKENDAVNDDYLMLVRKPALTSYHTTPSIFLTMMNVKETIKVSDFDYPIPSWVLVGRDLNLDPQIQGPNSHLNSLTLYDLDIVANKWHVGTDAPNCVNRGPISRVAKGDHGPAIEPLDLTAGDLGNHISITKNGRLTISLKNINQITVMLRITAIGPVDSKCILKILSLACPDGHYFRNHVEPERRKCKPCEEGTYNSIMMIEGDMGRWSECTKCPDNESTTSVGAVSASQCMCAAGYYLDETKTPRCQPCEAGTWKGVVGMQPCLEAGCYPNSQSTVIGSTTEEGRKCECLAGYYYRQLHSSPKECVPCEEGYYCEGGFHGKRAPCPVNMTTNIPTTTPIIGEKPLLSVSIGDCVCKAGYEPADPSTINDPSTEAYKLRLQITKELNRYGLKQYDIASLVCTPCPPNKIKTTKGNTPCEPCPPNTFSDLLGNSSIYTCNRCAPGYYETNEPSFPCNACDVNHICVGSDPLDPDMSKHRGKKVKCHKNSITIPPYEKNTSMKHCLCEKGYRISKQLGTSCEPVPKNTYKDVIGNVEPTDCPPGSHTLTTGATDISECVCKRGMFYDINTGKCTICPIGMYCPGGKSKSNTHSGAIPCPDVNATTKEPGASNVNECMCNAGYYIRSDNSTVCTECPENTYKSFTSNESCTECDENSSTSGQLGATSKEQCVCAPGYYFTGTCKVCGYPDKYCPGGIFKHRDDVTGKDIYETSAPIDCPPHTEIPPGVDTADSVDSCKCGKGYAFMKDSDHLQTKMCNPCPPGSYKSSVMDSSCNGLCTQNATSLPGAFSPSQCFCQRGYYYLAGGICAPCVEGARCDGGLLDSGGPSYKRSVVRYNDHVKPVPIEGYYLDKINLELRKPDDWRFIECPIKGACLGEKGCSESMTAYLCAECRTGFTNNFKKGALCSKCPSTWSNVLLTVAWYLALLLVNIVMACLNVSAGFNRRSIHSVVIKIALNYGVCMSVLNVINFSDLALPEELKSTTLHWIRLLYHETRTYYTSIDCLFQNWFSMKHSNSFFYSMLLIACLPVILLVVVTVLMWVILELFKLRRRAIMRSKLALLYQSNLQGMHYLADRLTEEYANERLFMIFRYIPLPGETRWVRFKHFLEDMIPIYVTVLFSLHGNTTSQMLSLLDCTHISLGQSIPSKYVLRPAMSIKCSLDPDEGYIPYLLLGLGGLIFWGFGIPLFSYIVLLMNRRNLYAPDVRMKYGFLHNGYQQGYWFWEAIVFTRKSLVLVIGSIVIVPSQNTSGSRIWMALAVAVFFLIIQLIYKPFDERDYFVLGRLESHSMISWTMTLIFCLFPIEGEFSALNNMYLLTIICIINFCFIAEVALELGLAYCDNVRSRNAKCNASVIGYINRFLASISEKRKLREPLIILNEESRTIDLASPKAIQWRFFDESQRRITYSEKVYFTHIVSQVINFSNIQMKLDIIPMDFPEFISRLAFAVNFHELNQKKADDIVRSLADGNLDELVNLTMLKSQETRVHGNDLLCLQSSMTTDACEHVVPPVLLFDQEVIGSGIPLSDFYMALSIIKMKDKYMIVRTYEAFKVLRMKADSAIRKEQEQKVQRLEEILRRIHHPDYQTMDEIFCSQEDIDAEKRNIAELESRIQQLKENPLEALELYGDETFEERLQRLGFTERNKDNRGTRKR